MNNVLISLNCHQDRNPSFVLPVDNDYSYFINKTPKYGEALKFAIKKAIDSNCDIVFADTDGYHPPSEIIKLAKFTYTGSSLFYIIKPYRSNIGFQSQIFSYLYSLYNLRYIHDPTGGLYRLSLEFMKSLPSLKSNDMTIHIEVLKHVLHSSTKIIQYPYISGSNDRLNSKRTKYFQLKLLWRMLK